LEIHGSSRINGAAPCWLLRLPHPHPRQARQEAGIAGDEVGPPPLGYPRKIRTYTIQPRGYLLSAPVLDRCHPCCSVVRLWLSDPGFVVRYRRSLKPRGAKPGPRRARSLAWRGGNFAAPQPVIVPADG
jgi:hypothetical protein